MYLLDEMFLGCSFQGRRPLFAEGGEPETMGRAANQREHWKDPESPSEVRPLHVLDMICICCARVRIHAPALFIRGHYQGCNVDAENFATPSGVSAVLNKTWR